MTTFCCFSCSFLPHAAKWSPGLCSHCFMCCDRWPVSSLSCKPTGVCGLCGAHRPLLIVICAHPARADSHAAGSHLARCTFWRRYERGMHRAGCDSNCFELAKGREHLLGGSSHCCQSSGRTMSRKAGNSASSAQGSGTSLVLVVFFIFLEHLPKSKPEPSALLSSLARGPAQKVQMDLPSFPPMPWQTLHAAKHGFLMQR